MIPPTHDNRFYVWDTYWDSDRIHSFGVERRTAVSTALEQCWGETVGRLSSGSAVLDVACGNGAAGFALVRAAKASGKTLAITAIDEAAIDPLRHVPTHADVLSEIDFRPRTPMESLPFENAAFDAVVSQFGIEFGNSTKALVEAARVLKPNGLLSILALPSHSKAVYVARKSLNQARHLLAEADLFDHAITMIQAYHGSPPESMEQKMQSDLERFGMKVEKSFNRFGEGEVGVLSAIVFCLYRVFIDRKSTSAEEQLTAIQTARTRLAHFAARAQATIKSSIVDGTMGPLRFALITAGFGLTETRPILAPGHGLLAYQFSAERAAELP